MPDESRTLWTPCAVALLLALFFAQGLLSLRLKSPTFDEFAYFGLGEYTLETHRFDVPGSGTHPPLAFYLSSLPSLHRPLDVEAWTYSPEQRDRVGANFPLYHDYERSKRLFERNETPGRDLDRGRIVVLSLGFLLGPLIFLWSRRLYGTAGGIAALVLFGFDPNLLAHARLTTPDFTLAVMCFAAFFAAAAGIRFRYVAAAGVFAGLALLSKHSALAMLPVLAFPYLMDQTAGNSRLRSMRFPLLVIAIAAVVFVLGYQLQPGSYFESLRFQLAHASEGHRSYLMGRLSETGWWYYYLVAIAIKTPLPLLALLVWSVAGGALQRLSRRDLASLLLPPVVLVTVFSIVDGPNIGLRYVLPIYPFLIVLAGGAASLAWRARRTRVLLMLLLAYQAFGTLRAFPDYLPYFNELVGGSARGYRYLVDSNLDWGQDLKQLRAYVDEHELGEIHFDYFGSAEPAQYGIEYQSLSAETLDRALSRPDEFRGTLAVSATQLVGAYSEHDTYERLRQRTPDAVIGNTIFLYRFD